MSIQASLPPPDLLKGLDGGGEEMTNWRVNKYCKHCIHTSWDEKSVVVCDHQDVYDECFKANVEDSPPRVRDAIEVCKGEYFDDKDDIDYEIN